MQVTILKLKNKNNQVVVFNLIKSTADIRHVCILRILFPGNGCCSSKQSFQLRQLKKTVCNYITQSFVLSQHGTGRQILSRARLTLSAQGPSKTKLIFIMAADS